MNKYQKIAAQMAKDDLRKEIYKFNVNFREFRNGHMCYFRKSNISIKGARAYRSYNKNNWF